MEFFEKYSDTIINMGIDYAPKLLLALITLLVGLWLIKIITNSVGRLLNRKHIDSSLQPFLKSLFDSVLKPISKICFRYN